jgi:hypothetical protein
MGLSIMNILGLSSNIHFAHIACYLKIIAFSLRTSPLSVQGFTGQIMPILHILCYNGSLVTWMVAGLTTSKFKPLIFSMCGFTLSYNANMFFLMIPYGFCLFPAQFCYIIIYTWKVTSCVHIADGCEPWKISNGVQNLVLQALQFYEIGVCR